MSGIAEFDFSNILSRQLPLKNDALFNQLLAQYRNRIEPGWSLNPHALRAALWSLEQQSSADHALRVVEFGSGLSSLFLQGYFDNRLQMTSFEHDAEWVSKLQQENPALNVVQRDLLSFTQADFQR